MKNRGIVRATLFAAFVLTGSATLFAQTAMDFWNQGTEFFNRGDYDRAITAFTEVIKRNPNLADVYYNRGLSYRQKGDKNNAVADFTQAIRLNPNHAEAYFQRGSLYAAEFWIDNNRARAIADLEAVLRINPNHAMAKVFLEIAGTAERR